LSPSGCLLAIATDNLRIRLVEAETMAIACNLLLGVEILDVDFSADGTKPVGSVVDSTMRIYEIP
jgi:hypothetical protein